MRISLISDNRIDISVQVDPYDNTHTWIRYAASKTERFYGFGFQFSHFDSTGRCIPIITTEPGLGRGRKPTTFWSEVHKKYSGGSPETTTSAIPHYITSQMRSLYVNSNGMFLVFNLKEVESRGQVLLQAAPVNGLLRWSVFRGEKPLDHIREYTAHPTVGRMRPVPAWAVGGALVELAGGSAKVRPLSIRLRNSGIKVAGWVIPDWSGSRSTAMGTIPWWNIEVDKTKYPDWDIWLNEANYRKERVLVYLTPYVSDVLTEGKDNVTKSTFKEATDANCLVLDDNDEVYMQYSYVNDARFATFDFTNPRCSAWLGQEILFRDVYQFKNKSVKTVLGGFACDMGEQVPFDGKFFRSLDTRLIHNQFPQWWSAACATLVNNSRVPDDIWWTRGAAPGTPGTSMLVSVGSQLTTWDKDAGLFSAMTAMMTGGLSGLSNVHSDVGGHMALSVWPLSYYRDYQLLARWGEMSSFSDTVLRSHLGNNPGRNNQVFTATRDTLAFGRSSQIHNCLVNYRLKLMADSAATGAPAVRHMWVNFPNDEQARLANEQFMLGTALIVAPVLRYKRNSVTVYVPKELGPWIWLWNGNEYPPGWHSIAAYLGSPMCLWSLNNTDAIDIVRQLCTAAIVQGEGCRRVGPIRSVKAPTPEEDIRILDDLDI